MVGPTVSPLPRGNAPHTPRTTASTLSDVCAHTLGTAVPILPHSARLALPDSAHSQAIPDVQGLGLGGAPLPQIDLAPFLSPLLPLFLMKPDVPSQAWDSPTAPPQPYQQHPLPGKWHRRTGLYVTQPRTSL